MKETSRGHLLFAVFPFCLDSQNASPMLSEAVWLENQPLDEVLAAAWCLPVNIITLTLTSEHFTT